MEREFYITNIRNLIKDERRNCWRCRRTKPENLRVFCTQNMITNFKLSWQFTRQVMKVLGCMGRVLVSTVGGRLPHLNFSTDTGAR